MSRNAWIIFAVACIAALGGLIFLSNQNRVDVNVDEINANSVQPASEASGGIADHVKGNADSKVVLVEYADFQCPGCASAFPKIKSISEEYEDQIAVVMRNFPLTSIHPHALAAAATAEAAGKQGKFWQMHDLLFANQSSWSSQNARQRTETFLGFARQIGLDENKFTQDQASAEVSQKIGFDQALGRKSDVSSTPTFFLNGKQIEQSVWGNDEEFRKVIDAELEKQGVKPPKEPTEKK